MTDSRHASLLARWLSEPPGTEPPSDLDDDVVEGALALRPDLAPAARLTVDDVLDALTEGPLAEAEGGRAAVEDLIGWLQANPGAEPPSGVEPEVVEAVYALRPDLAPPPRVSIDEILGSLEAGPLAVEEESPADIEPAGGTVISLDSRRRRRWYAGATVTLLAAAAALVVVVPMAGRAPDAPLAESEAAQSVRERAQAQAPARAATEATPVEATLEAKEDIADRAAGPALRRLDGEGVAIPITDLGAASGAASPLTPAAEGATAPADSPDAGPLGGEADGAVATFDLDDTVASAPVSVPASAPTPAEKPASAKSMAAAADHSDDLDSFGDTEVNETLAASREERGNRRDRNRPFAPKRSAEPAPAMVAAPEPAFEQEEAESADYGAESTRQSVPSGSAATSTAVVVSTDASIEKRAKDEKAKEDLSLEGLRSRAWSLAPTDDLSAERADYAAAIARGSIAALSPFLGDADTRVAQDAAYRVAELQLNGGQYATALATIARGLGKSAAHTTWRARLLALQGEVHERRGDPEAAAASYRQASETLYGR